MEAVRKKLDAAVKKGYREETCYGLSLELDLLIESYIDRNEKKPVGLSEIE